MFKNEQKHPFYKPLWVRATVVAAVAVWFALELWRGTDGLWIALSAGMLGYAVYTFFLTWPKEQPEDDGSPRA